MTDTPYEIVCDRYNLPVWHDERAKGIGSSDAPALFGTSRFSSKLGVYADKLGLADPFPESEAAYWGKIMEPLVAARYSEISGRPYQMERHLIRSLQRPWQQATLDARTWRPHPDDPEQQQEGALEIKITMIYARWADEVPQDVYVQVQHQMAVTGLPFASVAVLFGAVQFFWKDVERNEGFIAQLIKEEEHFWHHNVEELEPPMPDASEASTKALRRIYADPDGSSILLESGECVAWDEERQMMKQEIKELEERVEGVNNRFRAEIKNHDQCVLVNGVIYTNKANKKGNRSLLRKPGKGEE